MVNPQVEACELSLREHVEKVFVGLMSVGLGGGCVGTYQGLVEMAELVRRASDFPVHTPQLTDQLLTEAQAEEEAQQAAVDVRKAAKR